MWKMKSLSPPALKMKFGLVFQLSAGFFALCPPRGCKPRSLSSSRFRYSCPEKEVHVISSHRAVWVCRRLCLHFSGGARRTRLDTHDHSPVPLDLTGWISRRSLRAGGCKGVERSERFRPLRVHTPLQKSSTLRRGPEQEYGFESRETRSERPGDDTDRGAKDEGVPLNFRFSHKTYIVCSNPPTFSEDRWKDGARERISRRTANRIRESVSNVRNQKSL